MTFRRHQCKILECPDAFIQISVSDSDTESHLQMTTHPRVARHVDNMSFEFGFRKREVLAFAQLNADVLLCFFAFCLFSFVSDSFVCAAASCCG